ncbi:MAG: beta-xylosidase [Pseudomonas sp.]|nr:cellulase family glycosylhydrolase [Pseudomonas sp.]MBA4242562.1 beta-xylosidase [Pseudomonas sp.]
MWRRTVFLLPAVLVLGVVLLTLPWSRQAEAEVTTLKAPGPLVWRDFLGVNAQFHFFEPAIYQAQMQQLNELGLEWVRIAMHWAYLEPQRGQFNLTAFDPMVEAMQQHQLKPVGFLVGSAPFATTAPADSPYQDSFPPKDNALYSESLVRLAKHYDAFAAWQIWNEPNIFPFWRPKEDPQAYAKLLFQSADALRAHIPGKTVVAGGMAYYSNMPSHGGALMLQSLLQMGVAQKKLVMAYHPYTELPEGASPKQQDYLQHSNFINSALRAHGIEQIWATEWGWSSYSGPKEMQAIIGVDGQADYTLRRLALMSAQDFDRIFLFNLSDLDSRAGPRDQGYGLLDLQARPKPVYNALANLLKVTGPRLEPSDAPRFEQAPNDLYNVTWTRQDGSHVWMFWSASGKQLRLPAVQRATLHDPLTGEQRELQGGEGVVVPLKSSLQLLVWR